MKRLLFIALLLLSSAFLLACNDPETGLYGHLDNQKLISDNGSSRNASAGVYENLDENLCDLKPYCCDLFSDDEMHYREMQRRAIAENRSELCAVIPDSPLVVKGCPDKEDYTYYNKTYCLETSGGASS
ncbi:MAG: hypothetical protein ACLFTH_04095 [Candidatus Woesearchaeota archaeon]